MFHERTFANQRRKDLLKISLKGITYLILDAYLNGIKKLEICSDDDNLFLTWQHLINNNVIQEEKI